MTSVYVPKGVTFIGREAFAYNDNLTELLFGATEKQEGWDETLAYRCPVSNSGNMKLGVKNPYASEDPEEDAGGETSGEESSEAASEEPSEEPSAEASSAVSAPPAEENAFPGGWVILAVAAVAAAVLVVVKKKK